jgi:hypothetical protein
MKLKHTFIIVISLITGFYIQSKGQSPKEMTDTVQIVKDTSWKSGGIFTSTFSQSYYNNWSSGGDDSYALNTRFNGYANYQKEKLLWQNSIDMAYGFTYLADNKVDKFRKNDDRIELNSSIGYKAYQKWYYTIAFNAKTQFDKGKDYSGDTAVTISEFLSPLNISLAIGMDYKPNEVFSAFISPLNLKLIYVYDTTYSQRYSVKQGEHLKTELGFIFKLKYQKDLTKTISVLSKLEAFYNYIDPPKYPYFNWEVLFNLKVFKALSVNLNTQLIYDDNYKSGDVNSKAKIQFKEVFGLGLDYKF